MMELSTLHLVKTSSACPEQYDVLNPETGEEIGYLRLRNGYFRAEYKGTTVYDAYPKGDGCFEGDEREEYLHLACHAIRKAYLEEKGEQQK